MISSNEKQSTNSENVNEDAVTRQITISTIDSNLKYKMVNIAKKMATPICTLLPAQPLSMKKKVSQTFIVKKIGKDCKSTKPDNLTYKIRAVMRENNVEKVFPRIYIGAPLLTNPNDLIPSPCYNISSVFSDICSKTSDSICTVNTTSLQGKEAEFSVTKTLQGLGNNKSVFTPRVCKKNQSTIFCPVSGNTNGIYSVKSPLTTFKITARTVASAIVPKSVSSNSNAISGTEEALPMNFRNCTDAATHRKVEEKSDIGSAAIKAMSVSSQKVEIPLTVQSTLGNSNKCISLMKVKVVSGKGLPHAKEPHESNKIPESKIPDENSLSEPHNSGDECHHSVERLETCSNNLTNGDLGGKKRKLDREDPEDEPPSKSLRFGAEIQFEDGIKHFITNLKEVTYLNDDPVKSWEHLKKGNKVAAMWKDGLFYDARVVCCYKPVQAEMQPIVKLSKMENCTNVETAAVKEESEQQKERKNPRVMCSACKIVFKKISEFRKHQRNRCKSPGITVLLDNKDIAKDCTKLERVSVASKKRDRTETNVSKKAKYTKPNKTLTHDNVFSPPKAADGRYLFRTGTKFLHRWQLEDGSSRWYQGEIISIVSKVHDRNCDFEVMYKGEEDQEPYVVKLYEDYPTDIRFMGRL